MWRHTDRDGSIPTLLTYEQLVDSDWAVFVEDNENNRRQNIPKKEQNLIQVQLIYSLQFVITRKKKKGTRPAKASRVIDIHAQ